MRKKKYEDKKNIILFGKKLREIRKQKGVSQEDLAYTTDLHLSQIGRIERGEINTSISFVFLFADTLGVQPADFFNFTESIKPNVINDNKDTFSLSKSADNYILSLINKMEPPQRLKSAFEEAFNNMIPEPRRLNSKDAIKNHSRPIELRSNQAVAYCERGIANYDLKNFADAIEDFSRAIQLKPDLTEAYSFRGIAKGAIGDFENAIKDLDRVKKLNSDLPKR